MTTDGKLDGFNALIDPIYTDENKRRILSFLGFKSYTKGGTTKPILDINGNKPSADADLDDSITLIRPSEAEAVKLLGGVVHSKPTAISYSANLDANGRVTNTREDYAIFGSMDGALHMVKDADGTEEFAIIPKKMIADQSIALVDDSKVGRVGQPYFGVDAPWLVTTDYTYDLIGKKVKVNESAGNGMFAYGGLRMGGEAFYGMDITKKSAPKMLFTITPEVITVDADTNLESKTVTLPNLRHLINRIKLPD